MRKPDITVVDLPEGLTRMESGPVQFGNDDWPGVFIRGDCAVSYTMIMLQSAFLMPDTPEGDLHAAMLTSIGKMLNGCNLANREAVNESCDAALECVRSGGFEEPENG